MNNGPLRARRVTDLNPFQPPSRLEALPCRDTVEALVDSAVFGTVQARWLVIGLGATTCRHPAPVNGECRTFGQCYREESGESDMSSAPSGSATTATCLLELEGAKRLQGEVGRAEVLADLALGHAADRGRPGLVSSDLALGLDLTGPGRA